jgi:Calcineurin-like phosphoesterase
VEVDFWTLFRFARTYWSYDEHMTRLLAVADEVNISLYSARVVRLRPDLVVACGDLPFDYLEFLVTMLNVPLLFVPGNHDPDLKTKPGGIDPEDFTRPFSFRRMGREPAGPAGCINADVRVFDGAGLRIAGLGGSMRYKPGPNQYTERQMRRRSLWLEARVAWRRARDRKPVDVLATHAPSLGVGDGDDPPHRGFACFHQVVRSLSPRVHIHGHVHPYGRVAPRHRIGNTEVVNVVGHTIIEI